MNTFLSSLRDYLSAVLPTIVFAFFALAISANTAHSELVDKVVAIVNDDIITLSELNEETAKAEEKILLTVPIEDQAQALYEARQQALTSIIDKKLIAQEAKKAGVRVSDSEVDRALAEIQRKASMSDQQFVRELSKAGLSLDTYRDNLRSQLLQSKIVNYDIRSKIVISESKIKEYYENEYAVETSNDEFHLLQIGVRWKTPETGDEAALKKEKAKALDRAKRIHNLAMSGEDFGSLAAEYSDFPSAKDRGDIGSFTLDDMSDKMKRAVSVLAPGDVSQIIETRAGFQFFKLLSSAAGQAVTKAPYEEVKDAIKAKLFEQEMQREFKEWVTKLKDEAYIQKL